MTKRGPKPGMKHCYSLTSKMLTLMEGETLYLQAEGFPQDIKTPTQLERSIQGAIGTRLLGRF